MGTDVGALLTKQAGPMPLGMWILLGGVGVYFAVRSSKAAEADTLTSVVEVPVPVGAVAAYDNAPLVMSPVIRVNMPGFNDLTNALKGNTGAVNNNTGAVNGNTGAVKELTKRISGIVTIQPVKKTPVPVKAKPKAAVKTYTVKSGDTLWAIAQRYTGKGTRWPELFAVNSALINSVAAKRGKAGGGHWIFPGTVLRIPW